MENLVEVNNVSHKHVRIDPSKQEQHGANLRLIPVVVTEFTNLAVQSPIVLTKNVETGAFVFVAMTGFDEAENLFWQNNEWQGLYVPLQIQRQPFFLGRSEQESMNGSYAVCLNTSSPMLVNGNDENNGYTELLFTELGEETEYFQRAKQCLVQILQGEAENEKFLLLLKQFDLIQPLSLDVTFVNQQKSRLNGLYTIDQEKLAALSHDKIVSLHTKQLLQPIYTMIASLGQVYALIERKNERFASPNATY